MMTTTNSDSVFAEPRSVLSAEDEAAIDAAVLRMAREVEGESSDWSEEIELVDQQHAVMVDEEQETVPVVCVGVIHEGVVAALAERVANTGHRARFNPRTETLAERVRSWCDLDEWERGGRNWKRPSLMAMGVSLVVHAALAIGAGMIVLSAAAPPDRRDLVLNLDAMTLSGSEAGSDEALVPAAPLREEVAEADPAATEAVKASEKADEKADERREEALASSVPRQPEPQPIAQAAVQAEKPEREPETHETLAMRQAVAQIIPPMEEWVRNGAEVERAQTPPQRRRQSAGEAQVSKDGTVEREGRADGAATGQQSGTSGAGVEFAGVGSATAKSVVYVVDASGPMVTSLPIVLAEVRRSVGQLSAEQRFSVILFRESRQGSGGGEHSERFSESLVKATPERKRELEQWLARIEPAGRSNPLIGLESALRLRPDVVFVLSRSVERSAGGVWGMGMTATIERLEELNPALEVEEEAEVEPAASPFSAGRAVQIQTIAFLDDDSTGIMQAIADRHGPRDGSGYRVIRRSEELLHPR